MRGQGQRTIHSLISGTLPLVFWFAHRRAAWKNRISLAIYLFESKGTHKGKTTFKLPFICSPIYALEGLRTLWPSDYIPPNHTWTKTSHLLNMPPPTGTTLRRPTRSTESLHECHSIIPTSEVLPDTLMTFVLADPKNCEDVSMTYSVRPSGISIMVFFGSSLVKDRFIVLGGCGEGYGWAA